MYISCLWELPPKMDATTRIAPIIKTLVNCGLLQTQTQTQTQTFDSLKGSVIATTLSSHYTLHCRGREVRNDKCDPAKTPSPILLRINSRGPRRTTQ